MRLLPRATLAPAGLAVVATVLAGCGGPSSAGATSTDPGAPSGDLTVFAAASLTEAFTQIGDDLMAENPDLTVTFNFGASSSLAQQVVSGAPADVFASAAPAPMEILTDAALTTSDPVVFARNRLEIAVPAGNPAGVTGLTDLADPARTIGLCAPEVPCGAAAEKVFAAAGLTPAPDTLEQDVKAALMQVRLGEVDAALVYRTDVLAAGGAVEGIEFAEADRAVNDYPLAVLEGAPNSAAAQAFVEFVLSSEGQAVLDDAGFDRP